MQAGGIEHSRTASGEGIRPSGFVVRTERSLTVRRWLGVYSRVAGEPRLAPAQQPLQEMLPPKLSLGYIDIGGRLLSGVNANLQVSPEHEAYTLAASFLPPIPSRRGLDGTRFYQPGDLNISTVGDKLQVDEALSEKYVFDYDETSKSLFIHYRDRLSVGADAPAFQLQAIEEMGAMGFLLSVTETGLTQDHVGRFGVHYRALGDLIPAFMRSLYEQYGEDVPGREFVMKPQPSTEKRVALAEEGVTDALHALQLAEIVGVAQQVKAEEVASQALAAMRDAADRAQILEQVEKDIARRYL